MQSTVQLRQGPPQEPAKARACAWNEAALAALPLACNLAMALNLCGSLDILPEYSQYGTLPSYSTRLSQPTAILSPHLFSKPMFHHSAPTYVMDMHPRPGHSEWLHR